MADKVMRLFITVEQRTIKANDLEYFVARQKDGIWRAYGEKAKKPADMNIAEYLFHPEEVVDSCPNGDWIDVNFT